MSAQHTPGPWSVDAKEAWVTQGTRDKPIAALLWPTEIRSEAETMANAILIAAAPELLAALKYAARMVNASECDINYIRSAIAKAEGSTP